MLEAIYKQRCLRCGGDISSLRLYKGEFCDKCMQEEITSCNDMLEFKKYCIANEKLNKFNAFFKEKTGSELSPIQKMWAKRYFLDNSFALLAPTGIGKTTFGLLLAGFEKSAYIIFPTKLLVLQAIEKMKNFGIDVLAYTGKKSEKEKIKKGEYDILITTTQFLYKNREIINKDFKLVFVDDVDSILKSAKRIEDVLSLLVDKEDIEKAKELLNSNSYEVLNVKKKGNLLVSSATANPKSKRVKLFRILLGFEVAKPILSLRNIEDLYDNEFSYEKSLVYLKKLGKGGLVFLNSKDEVYKYIEFLSQNGVVAYSYEEFDKHLDEFKEGKCYLVGIASYKNPLARGIDLPQYIRYTLFVGVPKMEFKINEENFKSFYFIGLMLLSSLSLKMQKDEALKLQFAINYLKNFLNAFNIKQEYLEKINQRVEFIKELIKKYEEDIKNSPEISFDGEKIIVGDVTGYIQASGRSSRFYKGHLTKGLSLVLVDNQKAFYYLQKRLKYSDIEFKNIKDVNIEEILKEVDESRKVEKKDEFKTTFVIVESPTKAKTIASFFGRPSRRIINNVAVYEILLEDRALILCASVGHDFDLVDDEGVWGVKDKYIPIFKVLEEKENILNALNLTSFEVDEVYVATDPDREGEKISFDLSLNNKILNQNIKRAEFHEITKYAFVNAIKNPREVDLNLVASQFVRRIADRWIGFKLSGYIQRLFKNAHLSAGRVQTPVLNWICQRTKELNQKVYVIDVFVDGVKIEFEFDEKQKAKEYIGKTIKIQELQKIQKEEITTPFNTSLLLKTSAKKLKLSPQKTMQIAQELFELGLITYHRTDSLRISPLGKEIAKEFIKENFGEEYVKLRSFEEGGAHEAIRTTKAITQDELKVLMLQRNIELSSEHYKVYDLIFRRFIASQMIEALVEVTKYKIDFVEIELITDILKDGFNLIYPIEVQKITKEEIKIDGEIKQKSKLPPYTYADIIDKMKKEGIGRPSTYAITLEELLERKYVVEKNGFLFATKLGFGVNNLIYNSEYKDFVSVEFTAKLEEIMDEIEEGKRDYKEELFRLFSLLF